MMLVVVVVVVAVEERCWMKNDFSMTAPCFD
jgi:hypothetical protein